MNMKTVRIYQAGPLICGPGFELSLPASQHVATVLRMQPGEGLTLFCGDNREFSATISSIHKKKVILNIFHVIDKNRESPRSIHLGQAISKGERMEWVIQKAVELGVHSITPLITDRCVVKLDEERLRKKRLQWKAIAISACEQSGRNWVPIIHAPCHLEPFFHQCHTPIKLILDPQASSTWRDYSFDKGDLSLLVGPEGGFSPEEIIIAKNKLFQPLRLGPRILRTETAAITALSILQAVAGDL